MSERVKGNKHPNWKGGRKIAEHGYVLVYAPEHPFCNKGGYVFEHRLIMENKLGRYLTPKETVHHINKNVGDNRPENLMLFQSKGIHTDFHRHPWRFKL